MLSYVKNYALFWTVSPYCVTFLIVNNWKYFIFMFTFYSRFILFYFDLIAALKYFKTTILFIYLFFFFRKDERHHGCLIAQINFSHRGLGGKQTLRAPPADSKKATHKCSVKRQHHENHTKRRIFFKIFLR